MKLTEKQRAARRAAFQRMSLAEKAEHIWIYYKMPIILGMIGLYLLCSAVHHQLTKKEVVLYSAHINVTAGDDLAFYLNENFISAAGADPKKSEVYFYRGIYLSNDPSSENHQYAYASRLKMMAAIEAKQLDVVLMNREAYDLFSRQGYLLDLNNLLSQNDSLYRLVEPYLTTNTVVLEDNSIEYALNEANRYLEVTEEVTNGIDVSMFSAFEQAGFPASVYLGVMPNSPRIPAVMEYIEYLAAEQGTED